ncbi:MAG: class I SAM-dependent methyltransferase [bacterium]
MPAREAYRLWAQHYDAETAVSHLENAVVAKLGVPTLGRSLLDVGCGTARRLGDTGASLAIGVDLTLEMLERSQGASPVAAANVLALPFAAERFDVVWCRLVIGHVLPMEMAYAELSRVCRMGGAVIVTDIAPSAVAAGHRRTFSDASGVTHEIEHFTHSIERQAVAAHDVALRMERRQDGVVDESIMHFYADAGRLEAYETQRGLPIVTGLLWRKEWS